MAMNPDELKKKLRGIVSVLFCPYTSHGELNLKGLQKNTEFLLDFALDGNKPMVIMTNGSTTECYANSIEEQKKVIKTVVDTVAGRLPVIAGVSQPGTKLTMEMARYAEEIGADCAMVLPPYYHHASREGLYRHYREIAGSIKIGVMVYNYADVSATLIPPDLMARLAEVDNIVACKDNATGFSDLAYKALMIDPKDMVLIAGQGEVQYIAAAAYGYKYRGFVSFIANFAPALSYEVYTAVQKKDFNKAFAAFRKQSPIWQFISKVEKKRESISVIPGCLRSSYSYMSVGKAAMELAGRYGGRLRLPMEDLTPAEKRELGKILKETGVL